jgi:hypothetical protein
MKSVICSQYRRYTTHGTVGENREGGCVALFGMELSVCVFLRVEILQIL